jgi:hypothetical protein
MIPGAGFVADVVNGIWYCAEGKYFEAAGSFVSAIPGAGDAIGLAAKGITGCTKASKAIKYATRLAGKAGNCALSAYSTSKQIWGMWDKYVFKGESWSNESWGELLGVTTSSVFTANSAKGIVADLRNYSYVKHDILTSQCFVEGTLIVTDEGDKPIEEIKAGDFVYSTNPETGESEYKEVLRTFRKESDVLIHIFVNGEEIETTPVHPFWVVDQWVSAKDLEAGDILTLADGTTAPVTDTYGEQLDEPVIVYNFEVSDFHTYYVTDTGVLVHNMSVDKLGNGSCGRTKVSSDVPKTKKGKIKEQKLPTEGKIRYVPPKNWKPSQDLPTQKVGNRNGFVDKFDNVWVQGPSRTRGQTFEWDVQLSKKGQEQIGWLTRDGSHANVSWDVRITHK